VLKTKAPAYHKKGIAGKSKRKGRRFLMSAYSGELSERKKLILKAVVEAHIEG
jgi:hypothetical protein